MNVTPFMCSSPAGFAVKRLPTSLCVCVF